ncbi:hypothetical protein AB0H42_10495 [Nocardia sp. NPDC050799]|uniref:hypothetical protein n=1 Tax=Nocardia sp. NPDC050799 TaxID=3154842 RepID=UPI0033E0BCF3
MFCETMLTPNATQRLLIYWPLPGTDAAGRWNCCASSAPSGWMCRSGRPTTRGPPR